MDTSAQELGKRLRKLREERGLTQLELARPNYTHAHVSTIEAGRRRPSEAALEHFAAKLDVDVDELLTGRPPGLAEEMRLELIEARRTLSGPDRAAALKTMRSVRRRAKAFGLPRIEARALELQAAAAEQTGDHEEAFRTYEEARRLLDAEAPTSWAYSIAGQIRCMLELGSIHHGIYIGENYLERLDRQDMKSPDAVMKVLSPLVHAYQAAGAFERAEEAAAECLRIAPKVPDASAVAAMYTNVAASQFHRGHYRDADASLRKAEELYEQLQFHNELGIVHLARGCTLARTDALEEARRQLERAIDLLGDTGNDTQLANAQMEIGRVHRIEGLTTEALEALDRALEILGSDGPMRLRAWAH
ncbi:MAG TPA: helix-turn-helix domain-containing protein, partial [Actinomycetota bacterium]|nr:helix-turn-helix domain-containing protein [Actinomycetota bacterium]